MLPWIESHEPILGLAFQAVTALIWIFYLQILVIGMIHQRRPVILIHRSAGIGDEARCFVSNMGAEPIYLLSIRAELVIDGQRRHAFVTDRNELGSEDLASPMQGTAQGPMGSGDLTDIGSFGDIVWRALQAMGAEGQGLTDLRVTALCLSGHSGHLVAAYRDFRVGWKGEIRGFIPVQATTRQVRSSFKRFALHRMLRTALADEAAEYDKRSGD